MNPSERTMLLIDADNVSVDVMEQAVALLLKAHGALHVRRAYCTAESALKCQSTFKRLGILPMVNLSTGKNSTDIALAVDALDLAVSERPSLVAIASSDSDFAPLVLRLREKGCRVVGFGQDGKTGDATQAVYDSFTVLSHRKSSSSTEPAAKAPAAKKAPRRRAGSRSAPKKAEAKPAAPAVPEKVTQILAAVPELAGGTAIQLRVAAERLREAGLLTPRGVSTRLFKQFPEYFQLEPTIQPNRVRIVAQ